MGNSGQPLIRQPCAKSIFLAVVAVLLGALSSCSLPERTLTQRYLADDGRTVLSLLPDGTAQVEERGEVPIDLYVGKWTRRNQSVEIADASMEKVVFDLRREGKLTVLMAKNLEQCPQMVATLKICRRYVSLDTDGPSK